MKLTKDEWKSAWQEAVALLPLDEDLAIAKAQALIRGFGDSDQWSNVRRYHTLKPYDLVLEEVSAFVPTLQEKGWMPKNIE